jgi:lipopolysaccharide export LptBFGC system permease protein LptF
MLQAVGFTLKALFCLWPLAFFASLDSALTRTNPLLVVQPWLAGVIATVLSAPLVYALAAAAGVALLQAHLNATGENLVAQLSGLSPWRSLCWTLLPAAILSGSSLFLLLEIHPAAAGTLRGTSWLKSQLVPEMMATLGETRQFGHLAYSGRSLGEGQVEDLRLFVTDARGQPVALGAKTAEMQLVADEGLQFALVDGVVDLGLEGASPVRFQRGTIGTNLRSLIRHGQGSWSKPDCRPFAQLGIDAEIAGQVAGEGALRQLNRYAFEPYYRAALGLLPLTAAAQIMIVLTALWSIRQRRIVVFIAFVVICLSSAWLISGARSFAAHSPGLARSLLVSSAFLPGVIAWAGLGRLWRKE